MVDMKQLPDHDANIDAKNNLSRHPLTVTIVTFLLTGVGATLISVWFTEDSKRREIELAAKERSIDSARNITNLVFERGALASYVVSSIMRNAPTEEIKKRKYEYDNAYIKYNTVFSKQFVSNERDIRLQQIHYF